MDDQLNKQIRSCVYALLKPAIRFCLKRSIGIRDLVEIAKSVFIDVTSEELEKSNITPTDSRVCAMTGIQRTAIRQYREHGLQKGTTQYLYRVIGQWRRDQRFLTKNGRPKALTFKGSESEFHQLVTLISTHLHPRAVLFALQQLGAVEINEDKDTAKLLTRGYTPPKGDQVEGFQMLASDAETFIQAVMDNIKCIEAGQRPGNLHASTVYDNLDKSALVEIEKWLFHECYKLHQKAEKFISQYDLDINPNSTKEGGGKIFLGSFTRTTLK
jgi:hypothetical protein